MSRALSPKLKAAAFASQAGSAVLLTFLTITHPDLATPIRVVNDKVPQVRGGNTYNPFAFSVDLPPEKDDQIGNAKLTIDAVDLSIIAAIRSITSPPSVAIALALASQPDTTEVDYGTYIWRNISYNSTTVSGDLVYDDILDINIPGLTFTPANVPGNF